MVCVCGEEERDSKPMGSMIYRENLFYKEGGASVVYIGGGGGSNLARGAI
jgi:hypothetical protein